jgi:imidazolonepropionase-like amidohydrolase
MNARQRRMHRLVLISIPFFLICAQARPRPMLLIEAGRILDVRTGTYLTHQGILIENDRIKELGDFATIREHAPKDAIAIDLRSTTVLPGLIDCHAHLLAAMSARSPGDPSQDIGELEHVKFVMKGGQVVRNELGGVK